MTNSKIRDKIIENTRNKLALELFWTGSKIIPTIYGTYFDITLNTPNQRMKTEDGTIQTLAMESGEKEKMH
jgi:hypothetical protein